MTTAFVLSGGGSLGAVQVGMLRALADQQVAPDLLVGTSVGALNAAFVAGHGVTRCPPCSPTCVAEGTARRGTDRQARSATLLSGSEWRAQFAQQ
jgi:hypothetical protein